MVKNSKMAIDSYFTRLPVIKLRSCTIERCVLVHCVDTDLFRNLSTLFLFQILTFKRLISQQ